MTPALALTLGMAVGGAGSTPQRSHPDNHVLIATWGDGVASLWRYVWPGENWSSDVLFELHAGGPEAWGLDPIAYTIQVHSDRINLEERFPTTSSGYRDFRDSEDKQMLGDVLLSALYEVLEIPLPQIVSAWGPHSEDQVKWPMLMSWAGLHQIDEETAGRAYALRNLTQARIEKDVEGLERNAQTVIKKVKLASQNQFHDDLVRGKRSWHKAYAGRTRREQINIENLARRISRSIPGKNATLGRRPDHPKELRLLINGISLPVWRTVADMKASGASEADLKSLREEIYPLFRQQRRISYLRELRSLMRELPGSGVRYEPLGGGRPGTVVGPDFRDVRPPPFVEIYLGTKHLEVQFSAGSASWSVHDTESGERTPWVSDPIRAMRGHILLDPDEFAAFLMDRIEVLPLFAEQFNTETYRNLSESLPYLLQTSDFLEWVDDVSDL